MLLSVPFIITWYNFSLFSIPIALACNIVTLPGPVFNYVHVPYMVSSLKIDTETSSLLNDSSAPSIRHAHTLCMWLIFVDGEKIFRNQDFQFFKMNE